MRYAEKYGRVRHAADENVIRRMHFGILDNGLQTHAQNT
jgi:hypothetical protein